MRLIRKRITAFIQRRILKPLMVRIEKRLFEELKQMQQHQGDKDE